MISIKKNKKYLPILFAIIYFSYPKDYVEHKLTKKNNIDNSSPVELGNLEIKEIKKNTNITKSKNLFEPVFVSSREEENIGFSLNSYPRLLGVTMVIKKDLIQISGTIFLQVDESHEFSGEIREGRTIIFIGEGEMDLNVSRETVKLPDRKNVVTAEFYLLRAMVSFGGNWRGTSAIMVNSQFPETETALFEEVRKYQETLEAVKREHLENQVTNFEEENDQEYLREVQEEGLGFDDSFDNVIVDNNNEGFIIEEDDENSFFNMEQE